MTARKKTLTLIARTPRLRPPASLTEGQRAAFSAIISSKPADYFQLADVPLLVLLVRHLEIADRIQKEIQALEPTDLAGLKWLGKMAGDETARLLAIMRSLRLTPQARYRPDSKAARQPALGPRPWEAAPDAQDAEDHSTTKNPTKEQP